MSLIYTRNSVGPKTVPCGTPEVTSQGDEYVPSINTCCDLLCRKDVIHCSVFHNSFFTSLACGTLSNAYEKSRIAISTCSLSFNA